MIEKIKDVGKSIYYWLGPFEYQRESYHNYRRVRWLWYANFVIHALTCAVFAVALGTAVIYMAMAVRAFGVQGSDLTASAIALMAASIAGDGYGEFSSNGLLLRVINGSAILFVLWGMVISFIIGVPRLRPDDVSDDELNEFRMMGYVVMEADDFWRAVDDSSDEKNRKAIQDLLYEEGNDQIKRREVADAEQAEDEDELYDDGEETLAYKMQSQRDEIPF